jgi:hypothetical protein
VFSVFLKNRISPSQKIKSRNQKKEKGKKSDFSLFFISIFLFSKEKSTFLLIEHKKHDDYT